MKTAPYLIFSALLMILTACETELFNLNKKREVIELPVNGGQKLISYRGNGIGIEFCLLNEQGEPATVFGEGENFRFRLTITNNLQQDTARYIVSDFINNPDLFKVFDEDGREVGKPVKLLGMDMISDAINKIRKYEKQTITIFWDKPDTLFIPPYDPPNSIRVLQGYFMYLDKGPLPRGSYYTTFTQKFCLGRFMPHPQSEKTCTNELTFKINFEIR